MSTSYIPYLPQQQYLMTCALQEWLPQGRLACFINDTVDSLNLKAFHARYAGGGSRNQPFLEKPHETSPFCSRPCLCDWTFCLLPDGGLRFRVQSGRYRIGERP